MVQWIAIYPFPRFMDCQNFAIFASSPPPTSSLLLSASPHLNYLQTSICFTPRYINIHILMRRTFSFTTTIRKFTVDTVIQYANPFQIFPHCPKVYKGNYTFCVFLFDSGSNQQSFVVSSYYISFVSFILEQFPNLFSGEGEPRAGLFVLSFSFRTWTVVLRMSPHLNLSDLNVSL